MTHPHIAKRRKRDYVPSLIGTFPQFFYGYLEAALFSTMDNANDQGGEPLDDNYNVHAFTLASLRRMERDCLAFFSAHESDFHGKYLEAGRDFWFTRCGHGCGFWDGDWNYDKETCQPGKRLSEAARVYGNQDITVYRGRLYAE